MTTDQAIHKILTHVHSEGEIEIGSGAAYIFKNAFVIIKKNEEHKMTMEIIVGKPTFWTDETLDDVDEMLAHAKEPKGELGN